MQRLMPQLKHLRSTVKTDNDKLTSDDRYLSLTALKAKLSQRLTETGMKQEHTIKRICSMIQIVVGLMSL